MALSTGGREGKGREGKGREGKGREGKGREGKGREGKGREGKGREGKGREGKGREGKGRHLYRNLCSLLLGGAHQTALLSVEGRHGLRCGGQPVTAGLEQLLSNLLSHLCLLASGCIHLVQLQQTKALSERCKLKVLMCKANSCMHPIKLQHTRCLRQVLAFKVVMHGEDAPNLSSCSRGGYVRAKS